jgi:hypothetical protein
MKLSILLLLLLLLLLITIIIGGIINHMIGHKRYKISNIIYKIVVV